MSKFQQLAFIFLLVSGAITLVVGDTKFHTCVTNNFGDPKNAFPNNTANTATADKIPDKATAVDVTVAQTLKGIEACAIDGTYPDSAAALKALKLLLPQVYTVGATKIEVTDNMTDDALKALLDIKNIGKVCNPKDSTIGDKSAKAGMNMLITVGKDKDITYAAFCGGSATQLGGGLKGNESNLKIKNIAIKAGGDATKDGDGASGGMYFEAGTTVVFADDKATLYLDNDDVFTISADDTKTITFTGENKIMKSSGPVFKHKNANVKFEKVSLYMVTCTGTAACIDAPTITNTEIMNINSMSSAKPVIVANEISDSKIWDVNNPDTLSATAISLTGDAGKAMIKKAYISMVHGGKGTAASNAFNGGIGIAGTNYDITGNATSVVNVYCINGTDAGSGDGNAGYSLQGNITGDISKQPQGSKPWPSVCESPPVPPVIPGQSSSFSSFSAQLMAGGFVLYVLSAVVKFM